MSRRGPIILARRAYRQRRLRDAVRLLPLAGAFLFLLPILWSSPEGNVTATDGIYLFAVWLGLVALAALMARALGAEEELDTPPLSGDVPEGGGG
ncbi:MAG: hypothetical protein LBE86_07610 [Gemmobacter sp.]|jgi:hypothetical protein|nr:hypothetical protein [Gemmobacter sp.]